MNIIKRIILVLTTALAMQSVTSCDIFYSLDLENHYGKGVYIWSQETGLKKGDDPVSLEDLNDKWYLHHVEPGQIGSFADIIVGVKLSAGQVVDEIFYDTDTLFVAIFDADELDSNWGIGKMSDYVIQKYWLAKGDVIESDGKTYKHISFPPNEGMKYVRMDPVYGTYNTK